MIWGESAFQSTRFRSNCSPLSFLEAIVQGQCRRRSEGSGRARVCTVSAYCLRDIVYPALCLHLCHKPDFRQLVHRSLPNIFSKRPESIRSERHVPRQASGYQVCLHQQCHTIDSYCSSNESPVHLHESPQSNGRACQLILARGFYIGRPGPQSPEWVFLTNISRSKKIPNRQA